MEQLNNSVAIKKGKRDGTTEFAHNDNPDFTADKLVLEKINKPNVKAKKTSENIFLFNLITQKLFFNII